MFFEGNEVRDNCASADGGNSDDDFLESSNDADGVSEGLSPEQQQEESSDKEELKEEIVCVICKALMLINQVQGSYKDFEEILTFAKALFFHNDYNHFALKYWPRNWRETEKLLKEFNYNGHKE